MTVSLHRLYSFRRCPYAMRARLGILFAELKVELLVIEPVDPPQKRLPVTVHTQTVAWQTRCGGR